MAETKKYKVLLTAMVATFATVEVEAEDEELAAEIAMDSYATADWGVGSDTPEGNGVEFIEVTEV